MLEATKHAGLTLIGAPLGDPIQEPEYRRVFAMLASERVQALVVSDHAENFAYRRLIVALAAQGRLPAIYPFRDFEGQTVMVDYRWLEGNADRLPGLVAELVQLNVNVMVVAGPPAIRAAQRATSTVPIVFAVSLSDPVASGFAASLARPGGNITGLASQYEEIVGKHVQFLSEVIPGLSRVVLLRHTAGLPTLLKEAEKAARQLGLKVRIVEVTDVAEYEGAFRVAKSERAQAVYVLPSPIFNAHRKRLVELAAQYRLPAAYELKEYVEAGGLLSYGPNTADMYRRAASYVDRILKGGQPGGPPYRAGDHIRARHQREDGEGAGARDPPIVAGARGSPNRVNIGAAERTWNAILSNSRLERSGSTPAAQPER